MLYDIEDGIYCELNERDSITYNIPIGATKEALEYLSTSLLKHSPRSSDTDSSKDERIVDLSMHSSEISFAAISSLQYAAVETLPITKSQDLIDRISAETVSSPSWLLIIDIDMQDVA